MKNLAAFGILIILSTSLGYSQVKPKEAILSLGKKEYVDNIVHLGESGFLLTTDKRLIRYSPTGDLLWDRELHDPSRKVDVQVVASSDGSNVFVIDGNFLNLLGKTQAIRQIDSKGNVKEFKIEGSKDRGDVISVFGTSSDLSYLSLVRESKKKTVLMFNRFESSTMSLKTFSLAVPEAQDSYWYYLGQWNGLHIIANKDIDLERQQNLIYVVGFDDQGQIKKSFMTDLELNNRFVRGARNAKVPSRGWYEFGDNDFIDGVQKTTVPGAQQGTINQAYYAYGVGPRVSMTRGPSTTYSTPYSSPKPGANAQVSLDMQTGMIYIYGLLGPDEEGKLSTGFYLYKYNLAGEVQWQLQHDETRLAENKYFKHKADGYRQINLVTLPQEKLKFMIEAEELFYVYSITDQGKVEKLAKPRNDQEVVHDLTGFNSAIKKPAKSTDKRDAQVADMSALSSIFISTKSTVELEFVYKDVNEVHVYCHGSD